MCNVCGLAAPIICPLQTPVLGALAAYFSVMQERDDIYSRKQGGAVGLISALLVGLAQVIATTLFSIYYPFSLLSSPLSSSASDRLSMLMALPIIIGTNVLFLIFTAVVGYFAGYLSVPAK